MGTSETTKYSALTLRELPTLSVGQDADLKIEDLDAGIRVWLSRLTKADGAPYNNQITVEKRKADGSGWYNARQYQG